jgi:hypothetical protein
MSKMPIIALDQMVREIETYENWSQRVDKDALLQALKDYLAIIELMNTQATDRLAYGLEARKEYREKEEERVKSLDAIPKCKWCGAHFGSSGDYCSSECRDYYYAANGKV